MVFTGAGLRAVVPDLIGFGRSDKPTRVADYSYQAHMDWLRAWIGARAFPALVPTSPDDPAVPANRAAWDRLGQ